MIDTLQKHNIGPILDYAAENEEEEDSVSSRGDDHGMEGVYVSCGFMMSAYHVIKYI